MKRRRESSTVHETFQRNTASWNGKQTSDVFYSTGSEGTFKSVEDINHPDFKRLKSQGALVYDNCVISRYERKVIPGKLVDDSYPYKLIMSGDVFWQCSKFIKTTHESAVIPNAEILCLVEAYAKMNEAPVLGGELLSSLNQTVGMLRRPFKSASTLLSKMASRRAKLMRTPSAVKDIARVNADVWLEYRYGWKPLIMDAANIVLTAEKIRQKVGSRRLVARAGKSSSKSGVGSWPATQMGVLASSGQYRQSEKIRYSAGVLYEQFSRSTSEQLSDDLGLSSRNIAPTLWESIPYSFVVDWFTNVGSWIQAVCPVPGRVPLLSWCTTVTETESSASATVAYPGQVGTWSGSWGGFSQKSYSYKRTCNRQLPFTPALTIAPLSRLHQADAAALLLNPIMNSIKSFRH